MFLGKVFQKRRALKRKIILDFFLKNNQNDEGYEISGKQYKIDDIKSNYEIKQLIKNISIWGIIVLLVVVLSFFIFK